MKYTQIARKNLLRTSSNKTNINEAIEEWEYKGEIHDAGIAMKNFKCQLCDHPKLRWQFAIVNKKNKNKLLIGSECINKFRISVYDAYGKILNQEKAKLKVGADRREAITKAQTNCVLNSLIILMDKDKEFFGIDGYIKHYQTHKAFSPKQLSAIIWRLDKNNIDHEKNFFRMTIKRKDYKNEYLKMEEWKIKKIWNCLSVSQINFLKRSRKNI